MSRSWSSAHDWKSCKGQKLFESSNLSISAKNNSPPSGGLFFFYAGWRDSNPNRTSQRGVHQPVRTLADTSVFPLGKNANGYSPSPPKRTVHLPVGCSFCIRIGKSSFRLLGFYVLVHGLDHVLAVRELVGSDVAGGCVDQLFKSSRRPCKPPCAEALRRRPRSRPACPLRWSRFHAPAPADGRG